MEQKHKLLALGAINKTTREYVHPTRANKRDEYTCPDCIKDLILVQGSVRSHHFRHYKEEIRPCQYYNNPSNTQIHRDAQMLLKSLLEKQDIQIERCCVECKESESYTIPKASEQSKVVLEHPFEHNDTEMRADVAYLDPEMDPEMIIFEIYHTHKTRVEDRPELWFEIDATALQNTVATSTPETLKLQCIRAEKCDACHELDKHKQAEKYKYLNTLYLSTLVQTPDLEFYVRYTLGQREFRKNMGKSSHLRFDYDDEEDSEQNMEVINKFKKFFGPYRIGIYTHEGDFRARFIDKQNCVEEIDYHNDGTIKLVCYILNEINKRIKQEQPMYASTEDDNDMWRYMKRAKQEARDEKVDTRLTTLEKNGVQYTLGNNIVKVKHPTTGESYQYSLKRNLLYYDKDWRKVTLSFLVKWYKGTATMNLPKCYKCKEYCSIVGEDKDYKRCTQCETWC